MRTLSYYQHKTIFITGGASGIGHTLANQLLTHLPSTIVLLDINPAVAETAKQLHNGTTAVYGYVMDSTNQASVEAAFSQANQHSSPHLVIHCAGINKASPFNQQSGSDFELVNKINYFGSANVARVAFNYLVGTQGKLAIIASMASFVPNFGYSAYNASKAATLMLAEVLRYEWKPLGVSVCAICPPEIPTPLVTQERLEAHPLTTELKMLAGVIELTPACERILQAIPTNKFVITLNISTTMLGFLQRAFPAVNRLVADTLIKRYYNKHPQ